jgi:hypothetical protein
MQHSFQNYSRKTYKYLFLDPCLTLIHRMVDDESTQDLIAWTSSGDQFTVFNNTEFSRVVLPRYFKHCNWSSFVRQLNSKLDNQLKRVFTRLYDSV